MSHRQGSYSLTFLIRNPFLYCELRYEVERAIEAGIPPENISLSTQELPTFFADLVNKGTKINACSLTQLERFGQAFPGGEVCTSVSVHADREVATLYLKDPTGIITSLCG